MKRSLLRRIEPALRALGGRAEGVELREPPPGIAAHVSSNIPLFFAKSLRRSPRDVATAFFAEGARTGAVAEIPAGETAVAPRSDAPVGGFFTAPGFINFTLPAGFFAAELHRILAEGEAYPRAEPDPSRKPVLFEFVSSNPTGPLHIGHGRCAAIGDVLARIWERLGYPVTREYYINDRGRQVNIITASVLDAAARRAPERVAPDLAGWVAGIVATDRYKGGYVADVAGQLLERRSGVYSLQMLDTVRADVVGLMMENMRGTLDRFNVRFDVFFPETRLYAEGKVDRAIALLRERGLLERSADGAEWFKAAGLGDDKDRVVVRASGEPTYFLSDIAYHLDKLDRGFVRLINVWGTDHHGYVARLTAALAATAGRPYELQVILYQLVNLIRGGARVAMSTREGTFVTLDEVIAEVGSDVARFFLLQKSPDTHVDFDFDLAKERSLKNPVYYIQYAHTRCCGIIREAQAAGVREGDGTGTWTPHERELLLKLCWYEDVLEVCAARSAPNHLCTYLLDLARLFHKFYENCRIVGEDTAVAGFRLRLVRATRTVLASGCGLIGVNAPERM